MNMAIFPNYTFIMVSFAIHHSQVDLIKKNEVKSKTFFTAMESYGTSLLYDIIAYNTR